MFRFDYVREFLVLADTLNFSKTADACFITQPALSRHVAILEEEFGCRLLDRTTRSVELTPAGQALRESFVEIMGSYDDARKKIGAMASAEGGELRFSVPYYWAEDYAEPLIAEFMATNPACRIRVMSCQPHEGIRDAIEGRSDLTISMPFENAPADVRYFHFADEPLAVACLADSPLAQRSSVKLEDLAGLPLVMMDQPDKEYTGFGNWLLRLLQERGVRPSGIHFTQQIDTMGLVVKQTGGVCVCPYGSRHMDRSYLRFVPLDEPDCAVKLCLYYRIDNDNPAIPRLMQIAKQQMH